MAGGSTVLHMPSSPTGVVGKLHPTVLFNICDSYIRRNDQQERVIGTLLGSVSADGTVDIRNSYAVPHNESSEQLDVLLMEDQIYHLRIFCTKGPGVFVQLVQSLEAIGLEVLNANLTSLQDNILNMFIAEIKDWEMMKTEDVKKAIMDVASRFGLQ